jgi:signal transduction histidine kinase
MTLESNAAWLSEGFTPHGFCLAWQPGVLALHVVSDAVIALSYYSIPLSISWLVLRRRDLAFSWALLLFAAFILACGTTHIMDIWTLWHADYVAQGLVKAATAAVSLLTAIALWPLVPRILDLPSPAALAEANQRLASQIRETEAALAALRQEVAGRERAEAMLRHSQKMQAIGQLTGGVAHDFNNLLMIVQGNLDVLRRRLTAEIRLSAYVERASQAIGRGAVLTQQLLAFARQQPLQPVAVDVNARVRGLSALLPQTVGDRVRLNLALAPDLWSAEADPGQLDSALLNLALNAGHAMPDGGVLTIRTENTTRDDVANSQDATGQDDLAAGDYIVIAVADTGIGMTAEVREKAFEPFFSTRPSGIGSGLGLSQVYGFVKQSHGHVSLESEPGLGTTVTVLLRRASGRTRASEHQPDKAETVSD